MTAFRLFTIFPGRNLLVVRACSSTSASRDTVQVVPQGRVLSSILFKKVMDACSLMQQENMARMTVYAGDLVIWCVGESRQTRAVQTSFQKAISAVSSQLKNVGLSVYLSRTIVVYRTHGRLQPRQVPLFLDSQIDNCTLAETSLHVPPGMWVYNAIHSRFNGHNSQRTCGASPSLFTNIVLPRSSAMGQLETV